MIYKGFFWYLYKYFKKGREIDPLFSSVCAIVGLQVLNLIFIQGILFFHLYDMRDLLFDKTPIIGAVIITILLSLNYFYFKSVDKNKLNQNYNGLPNWLRKRNIFIYWIYIIISVVLAIIIVVSIRNNTKWF